MCGGRIRHLAPGRLYEQLHLSTWLCDVVLCVVHPAPAKDETSSLVLFLMLYIVLGHALAKNIIVSLRLVLSLVQGCSILSQQRTSFHIFYSFFSPPSPFMSDVTVTLAAPAKVSSIPPPDSLAFLTSAFHELLFWYFWCPLVINLCMLWPAKDNFLLLIVTRKYLIIVCHPLYIASLHSKLMFTSGRGGRGWR